MNKFYRLGYLCSVFLVVSCANNPPPPITETPRPYRVPGTNLCVIYIPYDTRSAGAKAEGSISMDAVPGVKVGGNYDRNWGAIPFTANCSDVAGTLKPAVAGELAAAKKPDATKDKAVDTAKNVTANIAKLSGEADKNNDPKAKAKVARVMNNAIPFYQDVATYAGLTPGAKSDFDQAIKLMRLTSARYATDAASGIGLPQIALNKAMFTGEMQNQSLTVPKWLIEEYSVPIAPSPKPDGKVTLEAIQMMASELLKQIN